MTAAIVETIRRNQVFRYWDIKAIKSLAAASQIKTYDANKVIYNEGDIPSSLYIILQGKIDLVRLDAEGLEHIICRYNAGDVFGELGFIDRQPRESMALARQSQTKVLIIPRTQFLNQLADFEYEAFLDFLSLFTKRIRNQSIRLEPQAGTKQTALMKLFNYSKQKNFRMIELSQSELAKELSISRSTLSKILQELEANGAASKQRNSLILDEKKLAQIMEKI